MSMAEASETKMGGQSSGHPAVVKSFCEGRQVTYTGVSPEGEVRDCARCMGDVRIKPDEDGVVHLDD